ncbi:MAG: peptidoglycan DD-metalloendopeptidase family protein [Spiroplasma sp.]|nr:peptidoglycan DD-metalloendopeptidase family protein [Mycoplasmatales bacterium]
MKKSVIILVVLISFLSITDTIFAQSVNELKDRIEQLEKDREKQLADLQNQQLDLDETTAQINQIYSEQAVLENEIVGIEKEIDTKKEEIKITEEKIPVFTQRANDTLRVLQKNYHTNFLVDILFEEGGVTGESFRKTMVANKLSNSAVDIVNETIALNELLEQQQVELVETENELLYQKEVLVSEQIYFEALSDKLAQQTAHTHSTMVSNDSLIQAEKDALLLSENAGCLGDQVYGIDCGIISEATGFVRPIGSLQISSEFGARWGTLHTGIDAAAPNGTPIYAAAMGTVISKFFDIYGGNQVLILHNINGVPYVTNYAHMQYSAMVSPGDTVTIHTQIGKVGDTGGSTGPHLHFEINKGSRWAHSTGNMNSFINPREMVHFPPTWVKFYSRWN